MADHDIERPITYSVDMQVMVCLIGPEPKVLCQNLKIFTRLTD